MDENQNENVKVDYEALLKAALDKMERIINDEEEYFKCLYEMNSYSKDISLVSANIMHMSMADQLLLLKAGIAQGRICQALQKKYKFEKEESDNA